MDVCLLLRRLRSQAPAHSVPFTGIIWRTNMIRCLFESKEV